jgi:hypothetical protein
VFVAFESAARKGEYKSIVKIKNIIESACKTPFRDAISNPTVKGNRNNETTPSARNEELNAANPVQKSWELNSVKGTSLGPKL